MKEQIKGLITKVLESLVFDGVITVDSLQLNIQLDRTKCKLIHGDVSSNIALLAARGSNIDPVMLANLLKVRIRALICEKEDSYYKAKINGQYFPAPITVKNIEVAGAGFINFFF